MDTFSNELEAQVLSELHRLRHLQEFIDEYRRRLQFIEDANLAASIPVGIIEGQIPILERKRVLLKQAAKDWLQVTAKVELKEE